MQKSSLWLPGRRFRSYTTWKFLVGTWLHVLRRLLKLVIRMPMRRTWAWTGLIDRPCILVMVIERRCLPICRNWTPRPTGLTCLRTQLDN